MKVSGKEVAEVLLQKLQKEIQEKKLMPGLAIILAGNDPSSRIYVENKLKAAAKVGINAELYEFEESKLNECLEKLEQLNNDSKVNGIIIQHPVFPSWDYDFLLEKLNSQKDVDGFKIDSPFAGATALAIWEMLTAYALKEGFLKTEDFLKGKKIVVVGQGRTAGGPVTNLLEQKGFEVLKVIKETENPDEIIKTGDVVISATGAKEIIGKHNLKSGVYVIGVGVGKEEIDGKMRIYGDINEEEVSEIAKLYCPTIGGIGPLTIVSLLKNVVISAHGFNG